MSCFDLPSVNTKHNWMWECSFMHLGMWIVESRSLHSRVILTFSYLYLNMSLSNTRWWYSRFAFTITLMHTRWRRRWWGWMGDRGNGIGDTWSALRNESRFATEDFAANIPTKGRREWTDRRTRTTNTPAIQFAWYSPCGLSVIPALVSYFKVERQLSLWMKIVELIFVNEWTGTWMIQKFWPNLSLIRSKRHISFYKE